MCGICGFTGTHNEALLRLMTDAIARRGPDGAGYFTDGSAVSLGMRRLAVIDLVTGDQPIFNEDRSVAVVFNGEIYNFTELRDDLARRGHRFCTKTDTEVIVHAYEEYGEDCPKRLRGMFAFAVWDRKKRKLLLARDHIGIKPLFYAEKDGQIIFGSEIKSILPHPAVDTEIDHTALDHFLTLLYVPAPLSIYRSIRKLPAGHILVHENGKTRIRPYWSVPSFAHNAPVDERALKEDILSLLTKSVAEQKVADVPLGVFLSGGLDSSAIVALLSGISANRIDTFSIGYGSDDPSYNETGKAQRVADRFGCDHHKFIVHPDATTIIPELAGYFDEPFADSSCIPTYLISKEVRKNITVALTGIGGDELFAGYPRYLGSRVSMLYGAAVPRPLRALVSRLSVHIPESTKSRNLGGWIKRFANGGMMDFRERYISWITYLSAREKQSLYTPDFRGHLSGPAPDASFLTGLDSPDALFAAEIRTYLADDLLCLSDRMSMANSLELRVPLLDIRLIELLSRIPLSLKTRGYSLKYLLKETMAPLLPPEIINQRKMGFQIPLGRWINEEIQPMVRDLLSPARLRRNGYLDPGAVQTMLEDHRRGKRNYTDQIFALLMLELWLDRHSRRQPPADLPAPDIRDRRKILLVNLGGMGDIVMMEPLLRALKERLPGTRVTLLTIPRSQEIAKNLPGLDEIRTIPLRYRRPSLPGYLRLLSVLLDLRKLKFDVLVNLRAVETAGGSIKMRLFTRLIAARFTIGRSFAGKGGFFDRNYLEDEQGSANEVEQTARLLAPFGVEHIDTTIRYPVSGADREFVAGYLAKTGMPGCPLIGLNPGAFRPSRRWPVGHWQELIRLLAARYPGARFLVTGEPGELPFAEQLRVSDRVTVTNGTVSVNALPALLEKCDLYISNDTGPMHLAAAVGTKVVAIFGPGDVTRFVPSVPRERYRVVRLDSIACDRPCYRFDCDNPVCLTGITPRMAADAAIELLGEKA